MHLLLRFICHHNLHFTYVVVLKIGGFNPLSRMIFLQIENMKDCVRTRI